MTALAPFELHRATSVAEAAGLLSELADDAVIYAGGTELLLLMKLGFAAYGHLVDVKPIKELHGITSTDGTLRIGAAVTHRQIERSALVMDGWPELARLEGHLANIRVRSVGTLGGNLSFADPHSDPATFLLAADAQVVIGTGNECRSVPITEFTTGPYETALAPGDVLVAIELPPVGGDAAMVHHRFAFHERPAATVSCLVRVHEGRISEARVAVGSVGVRPVRVPDAEAHVMGQSAADPDQDALAACGLAAADASEPVTDPNGSDDYKHHLVQVMVGRCIREAAARAAMPHSAAA
jgi:aerobic carbon-monoxide dehydrogenase medium subunit